MPPAKYGTVEARRAFYESLDERLAAASGMESAALASAPPFNVRDSRGISMDRPPTGSDALPSAALVAIGPRYLDTLELRVLGGAPLEEVNPASRMSAALVNEQFVQRFSPDAPAIGRDVWLVNERTPEAGARALHDRRHRTAIAAAGGGRSYAGHLRPVCHSTWQDGVDPHSRPAGSVRRRDTAGRTAPRSRFAALQPAVPRARVVHVALDSAHLRAPPSPSSPSSPPSCQRSVSIR